MRVIATAGHVDHGKSTLVRALTGIEPDRWAEERRRGLTIDLGFAWLTLPSGQRLAFVDVPGHERFLTNMLAGVGTVPAVMFVVAADEGWSAQSAEHLAALNALGVADGLLVVTKSDLLEPDLAFEEARTELAGTSLADITAVAVSGQRGDGLDELIAALDQLAARLPIPDPAAPVRLWVDRVFTISGAGCVVTGTLTEGTLRVGDELLTGENRARVRGLQTLKEHVDETSGVARVAVNLRGVDRETLARGSALLTPDAWLSTGLVDVGTDRELNSGTFTLHIGSAAVSAQVRPLGEHGARLTLARELPLRIGDRALLRDPGQRHVVTGVRVLDVRPPALRRRGAARARAAQLEEGVPDAAVLLRRRGVLRRRDLIAMGAPPTMEPVAGDWIVDPDHWAQLPDRLASVVTDHARQNPLDAGLPVEAARRALGLPDRSLVEALVLSTSLRLEGGRLAHPTGGMPPQVADAVAKIGAHLDVQPFQAPGADWLAENGIDRKVIAAAVRAAALLHLGNGIVLLPDAPAHAAGLLAQLPQPFTASDARRALNTTRRTAIPLLEHLDDEGFTRRIDDTRRVVTRDPSSTPEESGDQ